MVRSRSNLERAHLLLGLLACGGLLATAPGTPAHARDARRITLVETVERAQNDPPRVLSALARLTQARAEVSIARSAYAPTLSLEASAGAGRLDTWVGTDADTASTTTRRLQGDAQLRADWALIDPGRRSQVNAAKHSENARAESLASERRQAVGAALEIFVRARFASKLVADAELSVTRRERQQRAIAGLVGAGLRPKVDAARAEVEAIAVRRRLQSRRIERTAAYAALSAAVGSDPLEPLQPAEQEDNPFSVPGTVQQAVALALVQRPELAGQRAALRASEAAWLATRRRRLPVLGVTGSANYGRARSRLEGADPRSDALEWLGLAYLRWDVLDLGTFRRAHLARARQSEAEAELQAIRLRIRQEVVGAFLQLETARNELARASEVLDVSGTIRTAQNGRYESGVASLLELLDAESVEQNARIAHIEAQRGVEQASAALMVACGNLGGANGNEE